MKTFWALFALALMTSSALATRCVPGKNCKHPECRCWDDRTIPGNLKTSETPQMVLLSFGNSINSHTKKHVMEMMKDLENPNGCPGKATIFIEESNTDPVEVKRMYQAGYEIALSTLNDTVPDSAADWKRNVGRVRSKLTSCGIPAFSLKGFRSPQLMAGGDVAMANLRALGVTYDATCVNKQFVQMGDTKWPYTYDFPSHAPKCTIGKTPEHPHNGTWQFLVADLTWKNYTCSSPSGCAPGIKSPEEVFQFLFANFLNHYNGNRAPFNLYLDPLWLSHTDQRSGTRMFLDFLNALSDTWLLTFQQTLDWIREPCDKYSAMGFGPWRC